MLRIGIIGSQNSHARAFARILNVTRRLSGARVVAIWGEEEAHTQWVARDACIPEIASHPEAMIGRVDAVIVDHRHARFHIPAARPFVEAGIPVFVDKPFSQAVQEGRDLLELARQRGVLVTSYSSVRYAPGFSRLRRARQSLGEVLSADFIGPCDINSEYGGVFFYGVHQAEMMVDLFGAGAQSVCFARGSGGAHMATVVYAGGGPVVTLHLLAGYQGGFGWSLADKDRTFNGRLDYRGMYLRGLEAFLRMVRTGANDWRAGQMLAPVAVLSAIQRAMASGRQEAVEDVGL